MLIFKKGYFLLASILFLIEISIAFFLKDPFIRPYVGDFLVVGFLYCFIRSFIKISILKTVFLVLAFAICVEIQQLFPIAKTIESNGYAVFSVIFGSTFEWKDILLYIAGSGSVLIIEKWRTGLKDGIETSSPYR